MVTALAWMPLTDGDIWWHLSIAREQWNLLCQHGLHWLHHDPLTFTAGQQEWINIHWLYQLILLGIHQGLGLWGLIAFHALCWGGSVILALATIKPSRHLFMTISILLTAWLLRFLFLARPLALTMFLLMLQRYCWRRCSGSLRVLGIVCIQIFLTNIQGLFWLGPMLLSLEMIQQGWREKKWNRSSLFLIGLTVMVCFISPWGWKGWIYPLGLFMRLLPGQVFATAVAENLSPLRVLAGQWSWSYPAELQQAWAFLLIAGLWIAALIKRPLRLQALILVPWLFLAMLALRNLPILWIMALPLLSRLAFTQKHPAPINQMTWHLGAIVVIISQLLWWQIFPGPISPFRFPQQLVEYGKQHWSWIQHPDPTPLRLFAPDRYGGFLSWQWGHAIQTYWDGRFIMRSAHFMDTVNLKNYQPEVFLKHLERSGVQGIILPVAYGSDYRKFIQTLLSSKRWTLVHYSSSAAMWLPHHEDSDPFSQTVWSEIPVVWHPSLQQEARQWQTKFNQLRNKK